jgi:hypothetical protein
MNHHRHQNCVRAIIAREFAPLEPNPGRRSLPLREIGVIAALGLARELAGSSWRKATVNSGLRAHGARPCRRLKL